MHTYIYNENIAFKHTHDDDIYIWHAPTLLYVGNFTYLYKCGWFDEMMFFQYTHVQSGNCWNKCYIFLFIRHIVW